MKIIQQTGNALIVIVLLAATSPLSAQSLNPESAYREVFTVGPVESVVPTVVEVPLSGPRPERVEYMVVEQATGQYIPSLFVEAYKTSKAPLTAFAPEGIGTPAALLDEDYGTSVTFDVSDAEEEKVRIELRATAPIAVSGFTFSLGRNGSLPTSAEVRTVDADGQERIILANSGVRTNRIAFLPVTAPRFFIEFTYSQPLQISELTLIQDEPERSVVRALRFLAQPQGSYTVYQNPDRYEIVEYSERGNLVQDEDVLRLPAPQVFPHQGYTPADVDDDGVPDRIDNCVQVFNADQIDINDNGRGDACDDWDRDAVPNAEDNCEQMPNRNQSDEDGDGIGDVCDDEESRLTEQYFWIPWAGMGIAGIVLLGLFVLVARRPLAEVETK